MEIGASTRVSLTKRQKEHLVFTYACGLFSKIVKAVTSVTWRIMGRVAKRFRYDGGIDEEIEQPNATSYSDNRTKENEEISGHGCLDATGRDRRELLLQDFQETLSEGTSDEGSEGPSGDEVLDHNKGKYFPPDYHQVEDLKDILAEIGKVALKYLLKEYHVFPDDRLSAAILCGESRIISLLRVSEDSQNVRSEGISFVHKNIQDFLMPPIWRRRRRVIRALDL
ncbi:hypothetical protein pdam_00016034 [Pocillopora damicornis]|uniref:Uncharacterized protein n=1 Tax=Pocillopora damicornis TaxID=46731 RepID=A0A3M6UVL8_POCDA|nr:hypothetical protein pdam_00016034 [Pocillopora damicornis]